MFCIKIMLTNLSINWLAANLRPCEYVIFEKLRICDPAKLKHFTVGNSNYFNIFQVSRAWPSHGVITFSKVHLRYRSGLPYALENLTFKTYPAEKLGIVGRTGSGKSSLLLALFRIVELSGGDITIDGMNVHSMDLVSLR